MIQHQLDAEIATVGSDTRLKLIRLAERVEAVQLTSLPARVILITDDKARVCIPLRHQRARLRFLRAPEHLAARPKR